MYARDHALIATPLGMVRIEGDETRLSSITLCVSGPPQHAGAEMVRRATDQLQAWFAGERQEFDVVPAPLKSPRGTALREGLVSIAFGATISYGDLAHRLGSSPRAIGQLCARNPLPILVPCHRVLGAGGVLGAYSAGHGPNTKTWLLDHERRIAGGTLL